MEVIDAKTLETVSAYAGQLSRVFHTHSTMLGRDLRDAELSHMNIIDGTITMLNQLSSLLKDEVEGNKGQIFSREGLKHVDLLCKACAAILTNIAAGHHDADSKKNNKSKHKNTKQPKMKFNIATARLQLDESQFLRDLENADSDDKVDVMYKYKTRLNDLQLHLLLIFQVVTVGTISRDFSSGKVDVPNIITQYERITRTAESLRLPMSPTPRGNGHRRRSFSSSSYSSSNSDSESDTVPILDSKPKTRFVPPPPHPPPILPVRPRHVPDIAFDSATTIANPPTYESHKTINLPEQSKQGLFLQNIPSSTQNGPNEKAQDGKRNLEVKIETSEPEKASKSSEPDGRLFKFQHNSLRFKIQNLFRSKKSLATEMKSVLEDTASVLQAFLIQKDEIRPIPHSDFHGLEATHMRTILNQLNDDSWFKTYSQLTETEHLSLDTAICPTQSKFVKPRNYRDVVALQVLQENRYNAWMRLLTRSLGNNTPFPHHQNGRVILAILREQLIDGESKLHVSHGTVVRQLHLGPPPPPPPPPLPTLPTLRTPPMMNSLLPARRSDLTRGTNVAPPPMVNVHGFSPPPPAFPPPRNLEPLYPPRPNVCLPLPPPGPPNHEAVAALTTYNEYTLRLADQVGPTLPRTWAQAIITQESNPLPDVLSSIDSFNRRGGNVLETKLRLTDSQSAQLTRLMEELRSNNRDHRFEWCWVEIRLFNNSGEVEAGAAGTATVIHLIAKRSVTREHNPSQVYVSLMNSPPIPCHPAPLPQHFRPPPPMAMPPPPPVMIDINKRREPRRRYSTDTESFDSDNGSSDTLSYRRVRRNRRVRRSRRSRYNDSDSDSENSELEEDVFRLNFLDSLALKRGDDLIKKLLDLWTPGLEKDDGSILGEAGKVSK